jgi:TolB-like protein/DNA-binding winged helix-turn-helix (wHTH) protein
MNGRLGFDRLEFDPSSGELWMDGRKVRLQRQPSRLLALLVARPGELVSREEIRVALWGDTHVDFERSLNFCVAKLRAGLRDDAASPRFVETVPTRGYRFIAEVRRDGEAGGATPDGEPLPDAGASIVPMRPPKTSWPGAGGWSVAAAIAAVLIVMAGQSLWSSYATSRVPKIVVVPFHNETGSADLDRVAKGVSDAVVARLATSERLPRLLVIGNATDLRFSFKPRDMKATGESLGAQYLLLGQLKKDDRHLRVVAHLIRVSDQTHLWANTYDTEVLDLPQQASLAEQIAGAVSDLLARR